MSINSFPHYQERDSVAIDHERLKRPEILSGVQTEPN